MPSSNRLIVVVIAELARTVDRSVVTTPDSMPPEICS